MDRPISERRNALSPPISATRRGLVIRAARLAGGGILAAAGASITAGRVAAEDHTITLAGAASRLTVSPGAAAAQGAIASAAADRGQARVQAASALAGADSGGETFAHAAAALVAADPNRGAITQSAATTASALAAEDHAGDRVAAPRTIASAPGAPGAGRGGRGGGRAAGGGVRRLRGGGVIGSGRSRQRTRQRDRVGKLPVAGVGDSAPATTASLFGFASGVAALGAFILRRADSVDAVQ